MASPPRTIEPCPEQTISVADEPYDQLMQRAQWVRAAILGANDGLLSTTSLMLGIGAANDDKWPMILSGLAGALAGASSMAVGEFVSVSTQRDIEQASNTHIAKQQDDINKIKKISSSPVIVLDPNSRQSISPGRSPIIKVMTNDLKNQALVTLVHGGDDHHKETIVLSNPYKAALASASAFLCGSVVPLASVVFIDNYVMRIVMIIVVSSIALVVFGCLGAYVGGSPVRVSAARVLFGGWIAMGVTYGLLKPFDKHNDGSDTD